MIKHPKKIIRQKPTNCLSVFDHFVGLALKGLISWNGKTEFFQGLMKLRTLAFNFLIESMFLISALSLLYCLAQCRKEDVLND